MTKFCVYYYVLNPERGTNGKHLGIVQRVSKFMDYILAANWDEARLRASELCVELDGMLIEEIDEYEW